MTATEWTVVIGAIGGVITTVIAGLGGALTMWITTRQKAKAESEDAAIVRYKDLIKYQGEEIEKLREELDKIKVQVTALAAEHMNCQVQMNSLYAWATFSHRLNLKFAAALNLDAEKEIPPLPARPMIQTLPPDEKKVK
jgi:predicted RNase H-like nuclease (RuvC/YqgF family)